MGLSDMQEDRSLDGSTPHFDEAYANAVSSVDRFLRQKTDPWRVLLITDLTSQLRTILWCPDEDWKQGRDQCSETLAVACGPYWSDSVIRGRTGADHPDSCWQEAAWNQAKPASDSQSLRVLQRHRAKSAWFDDPTDPPWPGGQHDSTIALFYSFKGGVGRSTALAATALHLAATGERVVVLDADFDAPGLGSLLPDRDRTTSRHGIVDYLLEQPVLAANDIVADVGEYYHRSLFSYSGTNREILVFPAGTLNADFVHKLGRVDYTHSLSTREHPFLSLLGAIRDNLNPQWILIDSRAGLGEASGLLTGGLCHINVLFGALAEASWDGSALLLDRLGAQRVQASTPRPQGECVWVASMVPQRGHQEVMARFSERSRDLFAERYYAHPNDGDGPWTLDDLEDDDAPHVPVAIMYDPILIDIPTATDVSESLLRSWPYQNLVNRMLTCRERLVGETD